MNINVGQGIPILVWVYLDVDLKLRNVLSIDEVVWKVSRHSPQMQNTLLVIEALITDHTPHGPVS